MVKPMKYSELVGLLMRAGYTRSQGKGDHEKWRLGAELVVITQTREVSPGLVSKALKSIDRSKQEEAQ